MIKVMLMLEDGHFGIGIKKAMDILIIQKFCKSQVCGNGQDNTKSTAFDLLIGLEI